jgi:hypothetical protein
MFNGGIKIEWVTEDIIEFSKDILWFEDSIGWWIIVIIWVRWAVIIIVKTDIKIR